LMQGGGQKVDTALLRLHRTALCWRARYPPKKIHNVVGSLLNINDIDASTAVHISYLTVPPEIGRCLDRARSTPPDIGRGCPICGPPFSISGNIPPATIGIGPADLGRKPVRPLYNFPIDGAAAPAPPATPRSEEPDEGRLRWCCADSGLGPKLFNS
jgi:hypothetical protein